jgi:hypothetical protein
MSFLECLDAAVVAALQELFGEVGDRTQTVNRLHRLLLELFPGGAKRFLSSRQARGLIATVKPRDIVGKTRRRLAVELVVLSSRVRQEDQDRGERPHRARPGPRIHSDAADRRGSHRCRAAARRRGRHSPLRRSGPVRVLERQRTAGRLLRTAERVGALNAQSERRPSRLLPRGCPRGHRRCRPPRCSRC